MKNTAPRKGTLEFAIAKFIAEANYPEGTTFNVYAWELTHDGQGWSTNDGWRMGSDCDLEEVLTHARGRWEAFKANYGTKSRVSDLEDTGFESTISLEVDCKQFLELRANLPIEKTAPDAMEKALAFEHENPPAPFNPDFDPQATERHGKVIAEMQDAGFYEEGGANFKTQEERKAEYARRYEAAKAAELPEELKPIFHP